MTPSQGKMRLKSALQKLNLLTAKAIWLRIVTQPRFRKKSFYVKLTTVSTAKENKR